MGIGASPGDSLSLGVGAGSGVSIAFRVRELRGFRRLEFRVGFRLEGFRALGSELNASIA